MSIVTPVTSSYSTSASFVFQYHPHQFIKMAPMLCLTKVLLYSALVSNVDAIRGVRYETDKKHRHVLSHRHLMMDKENKSRSSASPTTEPTVEPSSEPLAEARIDTSSPSLEPSSSPVPSSHQPSASPSLAPTTLEPSGVPSDVPSSGPSGSPSVSPTGRPSSVPSFIPTVLPSGAPTKFPSSSPSTDTPSLIPSELASNTPSDIISSSTLFPSIFASDNPTEQPVSPFPTELDDINVGSDSLFGDLALDKADQFGIGTDESNSPTTFNSMTPSEAPQVDSLVPTEASSDFTSNAPSFSDFSNQPSANTASSMPSDASSNEDENVVGDDNLDNEYEDAETLAIGNSPVSEPSEQPAALPTSKQWWYLGE